MGLSIGFLQQHHPFARFGAANQITTLRAILVALVAGLVGEPTLPSVAAAAVAASVVVTLLDGVDGWLARRAADRQPFRRPLRHGDRRAADSRAVGAGVALSTRPARGWSLSGLLRYAFVAGGAVAPWLRAPLSAEPAAADDLRDPDRRADARHVAGDRTAGQHGARRRCARRPELFISDRHRVAVAARGVRRALSAAARRSRCSTRRSRSRTSGRRRRFAVVGRVLGRVRRVSVPDARRANAWFGMPSRATLRWLAGGWVLLVLGHYADVTDAGALRPRHQPVLGHPLHAGRRGDDRARRAALAHRLRSRRGDGPRSRCCTSLFRWAIGRVADAVAEPRGRIAIALIASAMLIMGFIAPAGRHAFDAEPMFADAGHANVRAAGCDSSPVRSARRIRSRQARRWTPVWRW